MVFHGDLVARCSFANGFRGIPQNGCADGIRHAAADGIDGIDGIDGPAGIDGPLK